LERSRASFKRSPARRSSGKSSAAVLNCLFKATDADVNEGTLYKDLSAQFSRGLFGRVIELGQRRVRVSALEECEDQAQSRLGRAYVQLPGLGDGDRGGVGVVWRRSAGQSREPPDRPCDGPPTLPPRQLHDRRALPMRLLQPERVVDNCREGAFGRVE